MSKTLEQMQSEIGEWGDATFPKSTPGSVLSHLREEVEELFVAWDGPDTEEAADCFILLLQFAHKQGFSLYEAAERKMAINRRRTWKTTPEPAGHFKHTADAA